MKNILKNKKGLYIWFGLKIGVLVGIYNNNIGLWISLGLLVGFILEFVIKNNFNKSEKEQ